MVPRYNEEKIREELRTKRKMREKRSSIATVGSKEEKLTQIIGAEEVKDKKKKERSRNTRIFSCCSSTVMNYLMKRFSKANIIHTHKIFERQHRQPLP